jgi:hypothetical protein
MLVFSLQREEEWNPDQHVEKILGRVDGGDVTVACWEPGQISPYHCHPEATEIYFCFTGGGRMRTPYVALPRALRRRHGGAFSRLARAQGMDAVGGRRQLFSRSSGCFGGTTPCKVEIAEFAAICSGVILPIPAQRRSR